MLIYVLPFFLHYSETHKQRILMAEFAEKAGRYDDMFKFMVEAT